MSIATVITGGYGNGVFTTTIAEVTLLGYSVNPPVLTKTPRRMDANITKRLNSAESVNRYNVSESTDRYMRS